MSITNEQLEQLELEMEENENNEVESDNGIREMSNLDLFLFDTDIVKETIDKDEELNKFIRNVGFMENKMDSFGNELRISEETQREILKDIKQKIFYDTKARMFIRVDVENNKNEIKYYTKLDMVRLMKDVYYKNSTINAILQGKRKAETVYLCDTNKALTFIMDENTIDNINFKFDFFGENCAVKEKSNLIIYNNDILFNSLSEMSSKNKQDARKVLEEYLNFNKLFDKFNKNIVATMFASDRKSSFFDLHFPANFGKSFMLSIYKELGVAGEIEFENMIAERSATSPEMLIGKMFIFEDEFKIFKAGMKKLTNEASISAKNRLKMEVPVFSKVMLHAETVNSFNGFVDKQIQERVTSYKLEDTGRLNDLEMFKKIGAGSYKTILKHYTLLSIKREIDMYKNLGKEKAELKAVRHLKEEFENNNLGIGNDLMTNLKLFFKDRLQTIAIDLLDDEYNKRYSDYIYLSNKRDGGSELFIIRPKDLFLKLVKESEDNNFKKTAMYKADKFEELFGSEMKRHKHPFYKTTKNCLRIDLENDLDLVF